jgi:hypothetical protein
VHHLELGLHRGLDEARVARGEVGEVELERGRAEVPPERDELFLGGALGRDLLERGHAGPRDAAPLRIEDPSADRRRALEDQAVPFAGFAFGEEDLVLSDVTAVGAPSEDLHAPTAPAREPVEPEGALGVRGGLAHLVRAHDGAGERLLVGTDHDAGERGARAEHEVAGRIVAAAHHAAPRLGREEAHALGPELGEHAGAEPGEGVASRRVGDRASRADRVGDVVLLAGDRIEEDQSGGDRASLGVPDRARDRAARREAELHVGGGGPVRHDDLDGPLQHARAVVGVEPERAGREPELERAGGVRPRGGRLLAGSGLERGDRAPGGGSPVGIEQSSGHADSRRGGRGVALGSGLGDGHGGFRGATGTRGGHRRVGRSGGGGGHLDGRLGLVRRGRVERHPVQEPEPGSHEPDRDREELLHGRTGRRFYVMRKKRGQDPFPRRKRVLTPFFPSSAPYWRATGIP